MTRASYPCARRVFSRLFIPERASCTLRHNNGSVELRAHIHTGYVNPIYPYAIREAVDAYPDMAYVKPTGGKEFFTYRDHSFSPSDYFIFSPTKPTAKKNITQSSEWLLARGTFRPDQILDPLTEITFIAIAQQYSGTEKGKVLQSHLKGDPLEVYSIAVVPTGRDGEYTRVGYAVWEDLGGKMQYPVDTNMVWLDIDAHGIDLEEFIEIGEKYGLRTRGGRLVVHYQIGEEAMRRLEKLFREVLKGEKSEGRKEEVEFEPEDLKLKGKGVE